MNRPEPVLIRSSLELARCGLRVSGLRFSGGLLAEGLGQPLAPGPNSLIRWACRDRIGMPVLDQRQEARHLPLDLVGRPFQLVARPAPFLGEAVALRNRGALTDPEDQHQ